MNEALKKPFIALVLALGYGAYSNRSVILPLSPVYQQPYLIVYGRENCGYTQGVRRELDARRIPYVFKVIDSADAQAELFPRMKYSSMDTANFMLPVVDANNHLMVHPDPQDVVAQYASR